MNKLSPKILAIEELRRRAKDNKAKNALEFTKLSDVYFEKSRNMFFLICFAMLSYFTSTQTVLSKFESFLLLISLLSGVASYFYSYLYMSSLAKYYSDLEINMSAAFPTENEYNQMLKNENSLSAKYSDRHKNNFIAVSFFFLQVISLIIGSFFILY
jgi:hypothetical protein